jgi:protein-tyrosine phosphatase
MIDLHTHLLPGVDDGVRDMAEALDQLRDARRQGITAVACTPHVHPELPAELTRVLDKRRRIHEVLVAAAAAEGGLPEIGLGSEVLIHDEPVDLDHPGLRINGTSYALVEIGFRRERFDDLRNLFLEWLAQGYRPVLAHVERYIHLDRHDELLEIWRQDGVLSQVNASSIVGVHGPGVRERAWGLIDDGLVDLVASDVHGPHMRLNHMGAARGLVLEHAGPETARRLFVDTPGSIYRGAAVMVPGAATGTMRPPG